ncbi:MAG TPA: PQQ-binding-like beta-propeller repeat protein [Pyrinomonadaceae bacterium]|nr:PQQ-binding-like beta-propeller repeat protein [Pyrinomonadaceae bacterium]
MKLSRTVALSLFFLLLSSLSAHAQSWTAKLDKDVRFYQPTELGVVIAGTEKSLYAIDGSTGDTLWRRKDISLEETDVAPVPGTEMLLLNLEKSDKSRVEAVNLLTGDSIWRTDKIKGSVMHTAVDPELSLIAVVLVRDAKNRAREGFKRRPQVYVLDLKSGDELWKYEAGEVEMMPSRWFEDSDKEVDYTLDNYYPPAFIDRRLYVFYEGVTSFDARSGKERLREKYRVNEEGLALTEAEPIFADDFIYVSGHGRVRAISRQTGDTEWEAKDLGRTPEMVLVRNDVLYVRTGGQFTRIKDGETIERGPYGVSAIDSRSGKVLWHYKGADKGITNMLLPDLNTIAVADRDDLILIDARNGKRTSRVSHKIERASFGLINDEGNIVIGGRNEIVAFDPVSSRQLWRARHTPPGRGVLRTVGAIAARAASLYFRYGGTAMTAFRGVQVARTVSGLSWSRSSISNLQSLATASSRRSRGSRVQRSVINRIDPAHQLERLSRFLWHRERLATLRGEWMYFYTDLKGRDGNGLAGVNINNGRTEREIRLSDLDDRFVADEVFNVLYVANGNRLIGHRLN